MSFTLNLPVNSVSFGQVSTLLLRELYKKNLNDFKDAEYSKSYILFLRQ